MESIKIDPMQLLNEVKKLIHEGNVRRIVIKQGEQTIVEFPLTVGVVGAALAPTLAAVGAIAALITDCSIEVERGERAAPPATPPAPPTDPSAAPAGATGG
jgi:hypothetical protein